MTRRIVIAHGGTASKPDQKDGTDRAVEAAMRALKREDPVAAVVEACSVLEDDERFNAGTGSNYKFDGLTIEMDAAVVDSRNRYGAVSAIRRVKNPIRIARELLNESDNHLTGEGAIAFARKIGHDEYDPSTEKARKNWRETIDAILAGEADGGENPWELDRLREKWNYERPFDEVFEGRGKPSKGKRQAVAGQETIGAVAYDGKTFAAAASTGATITTLLGRVGDTPAIGAGLHAGEYGAVACSGRGNVLLRERAATKLHEWMGKGESPESVLRRFVATLEDETDFFGVIVGREDHAALGNRDVAWSVAEE